MKELSLYSIKSNNSVFINAKEDIIVALYINNILITSRNKIAIQRVKDRLNTKFHISDLGPYTYYLNMIIKRNHRSDIIRLE